MAFQVTVDDILGALSSYSDVPSRFGDQMAATARLKLSDGAKAEERSRKQRLARMDREAAEREWHDRYWNTIKCNESHSGLYRDEEAHLEMGIMQRANVYKCVDGLARRRAIRFVSCPDVDRFAKTVGMGSGAVVIEVLRAFERWRVKSVEAGYASVYAWMRSRDAQLGNPITGNMTLAQVFREEQTEKAKAMRKRASKLVADSMLVLTEWVKEYNGPSFESKRGQA